MWRDRSAAIWGARRRSDRSDCGLREIRPVALYDVRDADVDVGGLGPRPNAAGYPEIECSKYIGHIDAVRRAQRFSPRGRTGELIRVGSVEGVVMSAITAVALVTLITLSSPVWAQNSSAASSSKSGLMTPQDLTSFPAQAPDERVTYGADANQHRLDLSRVVLVGHSAGGHLAMWAAARSQVPRGSALFMANPLTVRGVVDLAGPLDLTTNIEGYEGLCRDRVVTNLMGGTPAAVPERYAQASLMKLLPLGVPQVVVLGEYEEYVPRHFAQAYVQAAERAGDRVRMILIPGAGHFEIASPRAAIWPQVESAIRSLIDGKLPP